MVDEDEVYREDEPKIEDEDPFEGDSNAHFQKNEPKPRGSD